MAAMSIALDRLNNHVWYSLGSPLSEGTVCRRVARAALYPFWVLASFTVGSLARLRNRVIPHGCLSQKEGKEQFARLTQRPPGVTTQAAERHPARNRYADILPYDHNRVRLCDPNFYFNASWVLGGRVIASQGPLDGEKEEFWRMIWETDVPLIVMLANCRESGRDKCSKYWGTYSIGEYQIETREVKRYQASNKVVVDRQIRVSREGQPSKVVTQLHLRDWPDQDVPPPGCIEVLIGLVNGKRAETGSRGPMLVHCSAGVGRTGMFLTVYEALRRRTTRVFAIVDALRHERPWMVQTPEQYWRAHAAADNLLNKAI